MTSSRTALSMFNPSIRPLTAGQLTASRSGMMQQISDRIARHEQVLALAMRVQQMMGLQDIPLPPVLRRRGLSKTATTTVYPSVSGDEYFSPKPIYQILSEVPPPSSMTTLASQSSLSMTNQIHNAPILVPSNSISQRIDLPALLSRSSSSIDPVLLDARVGDATSSVPNDTRKASGGINILDKASSIGHGLMLDKSRQQLQLLRDSGENPSYTTPLSGSLIPMRSGTTTSLNRHLPEAITVTRGRRPVGESLNSGSVSSAFSVVQPVIDPVKDHVYGTSSSFPSINQGVVQAFPLPSFARASFATDHSEATSRSARSPRTIPSDLRGEQDDHGHLTVPLPVAATSPSYVHGNVSEPVTAQPTVNLVGSITVDGRKLGKITASAQAQQTSLPARGTSRVNLRTVPIYSGMQIPA